MHTSLTIEETSAVLADLKAANLEFMRRYPGEDPRRQPVHTVYGGAHLFKSDTAKKLGQLGIRSLQEYAPNFVVFAKAIGLRGAETLPSTLNEIQALQSQLEKDPHPVQRVFEPAWLAFTIYNRVIEKVTREGIEDFRIDFEDGYGNRPDDEEDATAVSVAKELAIGMKAGTLPPFIGMRVKPLTEELRGRALRTMDIVLSTLAKETGGKLPDNFVVTLPKITIPEQAIAFSTLLEKIETKAGYPKDSLKMELMIEMTQSIFAPDGSCNVFPLVEACQGRCVAAHFGVYDYTASCSITAAHQTLDHPACDFARHAMQVALSSTGIWLSDGATNVMPIAPHRAAKDGPALTPEQVAENWEIVHRAWKLHFDHVNHSLKHAFFQGWDLNPAQLPTRYAAVFAFFLESLPAASSRLKNFIEKAGQATLVGDIFDDAATGQGLLNFFLRGINCGAITEEEALETGLTLDELRSRSFVKILKGRRGN